MKRYLILAALLVPTAATAADWLQFRGPNFGIAADKNTPLTWSATENIAWKTEMPGPGGFQPYRRRQQSLRQLLQRLRPQQGRTGRSEKPQTPTGLR